MTPNSKAPLVAPLKRGMWVGEYELLHRLAAGGMGEVFVARKQATGAFEKRVALKLLLAHLSEDVQAVKMFLDEARIAARMNHPNIVQIFDLGEDEGRLYLAMALVEGLSLHKVLRKCGTTDALPLPIVRLIAQSLCSALTYAHSLRGPGGEDYRVVHRDVTPSNVLLSRTGAVLLSDFGIAKAQGNLHGTLPGTLLGKTAYLAPEQVSATPSIDFRIDLYAAGLTLFEALTGVNPFRQSTDIDTLRAVKTGQVLDPRQWRPEVDAKMAQAIVHATHPDREQRTTSARALAEEFIDGPVAQPGELAAWLARRFEPELALLSEMAPSPAPPITQSASLSPSVSSEVLAKNTKSASLGAGSSTGSPLRTGRHIKLSTVGRLVALGIAISLVAAGWVLGSRREETARPVPVAQAVPRSSQPEAVPEPAAAVAPVEPPRPAVGEAEAQPKQENHPVVAVPDKAPLPRSSAVAAPRRGQGYLAADADPWAEVWTSGKRVGQTPFTKLTLREGRHVLIFKNPVLAKEVRRTVEIEPGRLTRIYVAFPP